MTIVDHTVLPDEIEALRALAREQQRKLKQLSLYVDQLVEQIRLARHQHFGTRSERFSLDQMGLVFNEAEAAFSRMADSSGLPASSSALDDTVCVPGYQRKRGGRRALPRSFLRVEIVHELEDTACTCEGCSDQLKVIGSKVTEQLDIQPARIQVLRHVRTTYAFSCGKGKPVTAPMPAQPIPRSMASPGTLAHVAVNKYVDGLPLYRQEKRLARIGVDLPRSTLASWMVKVGNLVQPLINLLREHLINSDTICMDETRLQVLKEPNKRAQSQSYLWVQRGGPPDNPIVLYDYDPSRSQRVPLRLLEGFGGYLQTDGYEAYARVCSEYSLTAVGCWAHARRKFDEAIKAQGLLSAEKQKDALGTIAMAKIQQLYRIEREIKSLSHEERHEIRQRRSVPLLNEFRQWLDEHLPIVPPRSALGKAMQYAHKQWDKLTAYTQDGRLKIDNNLTENAIRPFVIGRKNWLFCDSVAGANASANLYSLIETAKANKIEPYAYLRTVFTELPQATTVEQIEALLPVPTGGDSNPEISSIHRPARETCR
ncbi:MAG: IS66 family transposase [Pseudomonadota bacterium]